MDLIERSMNLQRLASDFDLTLRRYNLAIENIIYFLRSLSQYAMEQLNFSLLRRGSWAFYEAGHLGY